MRLTPQTALAAALCGAAFTPLRWPKRRKP